MARSFQTAFVIGGAQAYKVLSFREFHELSRPAFVEVDVLLAVYADTEDLIAQPAELYFGYDGEAGRKFAGIVESVTVVGSSALGDAGRTYQYSFVLVTPLSLLAGNHRCLIQQVVDVKDAVTAVLTDAAPMLKVDWRLDRELPQARLLRAVPGDRPGLRLPDARERGHLLLLRGRRRWGAHPGGVRRQHRRQAHRRRGDAAPAAGAPRDRQGLHPGRHRHRTPSFRESSRCATSTS